MMAGENVSLTTTSIVGNSPRQSAPGIGGAGGEGAGDPDGGQENAVGRLAAKYGLVHKPHQDGTVELIAGDHGQGGRNSNKIDGAVSLASSGGGERRYPGSDRVLKRDLTRSAIEEVRYRLEKQGDRARVGLKLGELQESSRIRRPGFDGGISVVPQLASPTGSAIDTSSSSGVSTPGSRSTTTVSSTGGGITEEGERVGVVAGGGGGGIKSVPGASPRSLESLTSPSSVASSNYAIGGLGGERSGPLSPGVGDWHMMQGIEKFLELGLVAQQSPRFTEMIMEMAAVAAMREGGYIGGRSEGEEVVLTADGTNSPIERNAETATKQWRKSLSTIADMKRENGCVANSSSPMSNNNNKGVGGGGGGGGGASMLKNTSFGRLEKTNRLKGYGSEDAAREQEERSRRMQVYRPHDYDRVNTEVTITLTGLVNIDRKDSLGRPIVVIDSSFIPPPRLRFAAVAMIRERMDAIVQEPYVLVFVMTPKNLHKSAPTKVPAWWCVKVYHNLPRPYKKNVQRVVFIHPTLWFSLIFNVMQPFLSTKVFRKFVRANMLSDIEKQVGDEIKLSQIALSPHVFVHDKKVIANGSFLKEVKETLMDRPLAAMAKAAGAVNGSTLGSAIGAMIPIPLSPPSAEGATTASATSHGTPRETPLPVSTPPSTPGAGGTLNSAWQLDGGGGGGGGGMDATRKSPRSSLRSPGSSVGTLAGSRSGVGLSAAPSAKSLETAPTLTLPKLSVPSLSLKSTTTPTSEGESTASDGVTNAGAKTA